jgi:hypothetical protein
MLKFTITSITRFANEAENANKPSGSFWTAGYRSKWHNKMLTDPLSAYGASYTATDDVIGVALDADAKSITFYKNNSAQVSFTFASCSAVYFVVTGNRGINAQFGWFCSTSDNAHLPTQPHLGLRHLSLLICQKEL